MAYPTSLPPSGTASTTATLAAAGHTALHNNDRDEIRALATKVGTGSSTPVSSRFLVGTGSGTSGWDKVVPAGDVVGTSDSQTLTSKTLTAPTITGGGSWAGFPTITQPTIDDPNGNTLLSFSTAGASAVNSVSIGSAIAGNPSTVSAFSASESNVDLKLEGQGTGDVLLPVDTVKPEDLVDGTGTDWAWQSWVPVFTGFSSDPSTVYARYTQVGKTVIFTLHTNTGTSNATGFTFTLPVTAKTESNANWRTPIYSIDNGAAGTGAEYATISSGGTTAVLAHNDSNAGWTASGSKACSVLMFYEAA